MNVPDMFHVKHWSGGTAVAAFSLAALAACSSPDEIVAKTGTATAEAPPTLPTPPAPAPGKVAFEDNAKKGEATRDFAYSWPAEVSAIPELAARLTAERDRLLAEQKADWEESLREFADSDCAGCVNRDYAMQWDVVANLPRFLSLSGAWNVYSGGAHGSYAWEALVWDRETNKAFDPKTMFTSPAALQGALGDAWCKALKVERVKKGMAPEDDDGIFPCPPIADLTVLVGSSDRKSFNRIGLIAAPYVAGSYAEGEYEVTLPVTPKVLAAVKPAYRAAFALGK
ncbi:hypothetical protein [Erythrobacter sp. CCH5-A1]|jgi:hypothetical protein|uniref:hypothetical protein n=1 Tax=Erythrobacter sp. CCH5-A1 TaxID=1768792 RepID=UPI000AAB9DAC|nr:hypothetical protein [Erythrobacter sp. CCH5-A1]